jgi:hypothetical protein
MTATFLNKAILSGRGVYITTGGLDTSRSAKNTGLYDTLIGLRRLAGHPLRHVYTVPRSKGVQSYDCGVVRHCALFCSEVDEL